MSVDKQRQLLPDVLNHQGSMIEKLPRLRIQLDSFDNSWTSQKNLLDGKTEKSDDENLSPVDAIYLEMNRLETNLEEIIKHLGNIGPTSSVTPNSPPFYL